jgi:hypothetical protein
LYILVWFASLLFILIKGNLVNQVGSSLFDVDLVTIFIAYLLVTYGEPWAGIFALSQGLLIDIFSGGVLGLFTVLYLIVFLGIRLGSRLFDLSSIKGKVLTVSLAVFVKSILLISFLTLFPLEFVVSSSIFWSFAISAIGSGLIGPLVFYLLQGLNYLLMGNREGSPEKGLQA